MRGFLKTETDQAAPNAYTVHAALRKEAVAATGTPERMTGEFSLSLSGVRAGDRVDLTAKDPMAHPVPFRAGSASGFDVSAAALEAGLLDAGTVRVELQAQEPVEAFAFGGHVADAAGKPVGDGYSMQVISEKGDRRVAEEIKDGKFALIFIDLQGEFPRIGEGDKYRFTVRDGAGTTVRVEPSGYALTRTDIANSSISTLRFKLQKP